MPSGVAFKFSAKAAGLFVWHNTIVGEQVAGDPSSNVHWRNNLILGRGTPDRGVMRWANATGDHSSDYNGYRPNPGAAEQYRWLAPGNGETAYDGEGWKSYRTLRELQSATGQEAHGREVDFGVFEDLEPPAVDDRHAVYHAMDLSFALKPGGAAVDAGVVIPTVNEDHAGRAPDLGALEAGQPARRYGPRWLEGDPFYR